MDQCEWHPTGWWRVVGPDGALWAESSSERDCRERMRPGDILSFHEQRIEHRWVEVPAISLKLTYTYHGNGERTVHAEAA